MYYPCLLCSAGLAPSVSHCRPCTTAAGFARQCFDRLWASRSQAGSNAPAELCRLASQSMSLSRCILRANLLSTLLFLLSFSPTHFLLIYLTCLSLSSSPFPSVSVFLFLLLFFSPPSLFFLLSSSLLPYFPPLPLSPRAFPLTSQQIVHVVAPSVHVAQDTMVHPKPSKAEKKATAALEAAKVECTPSQVPTTRPGDGRRRRGALPRPSWP